MLASSGLSSSFGEGARGVVPLAGRDLFEFADGEFAGCPVCRTSVAVKPDLELRYTSCCGRRLCPSCVGALFRKRDEAACEGCGSALRRASFASVPLEAQRNSREADVRRRLLRQLPLQRDDFAGDEGRYNDFLELVEDAVYDTAHGTPEESAATAARVAAFRKEYADAIREREAAERRAAEREAEKEAERAAEQAAAVSAAAAAGAGMSGAAAGGGGGGAGAGGAGGGGGGGNLGGGAAAAPLPVATLPQPVVREAAAAAAAAATAAGDEADLAKMSDEERLKHKYRAAVREAEAAAAARAASGYREEFHVLRCEGEARAGLFADMDV